MAAADPPRIVHLAVHGRVQGVGYRAFAAATALRLGLTGWVRNRRDGSVECVVAGGHAAVAAMIAACERGPPSARVDHLAATETDASALDAVRPGERVSVLATV